LNKTIKNNEKHLLIVNVLPSWKAKKSIEEGGTVDVVILTESAMGHF
jgi:hypothetical protein